MNIQPCGNCILVKIVGYPGGKMEADENQVHYSNSRLAWRGVVLQASQEAWCYMNPTMPMASVGDEILFHASYDELFRLDGEDKLALLRTGDILAVISE